MLFDLNVLFTLHKDNSLVLIFTSELINFSGTCHKTQDFLWALGAFKLILK